MSQNASLETLLEQKEELEQQITELQKEQKVEAILKIRKIMETMNLTVEDIERPVRKPRAKMGPVPVKYEKDGEKWSGRGMKPKWVRDFLAAGGTLEDIAV